MNERSETKIFLMQEAVRLARLNRKNRHEAISPVVPFDAPVPLGDAGPYAGHWPAEAFYIFHECLGTHLEAGQPIADAEFEAEKEARIAWDELLEGMKEFNRQRGFIPHHRGDRRFTR